MENQRLSKGLPHFYGEVQLEAIKVDKCIQDFDKLYQEYLKQKKVKEVEQAQPSPTKKKWKLIKNDLGSSASEQQHGTLEGSNTLLVTYDYSNEGEGLEEVADILRILKENPATKEPQPAPVFQEKVHGYHVSTMENDEPIDTEDEREEIYQRFIKQDDFIKTQEFKYSWIKYKMKYFDEREKKVGRCGYITIWCHSLENN